MTERRYRIVDNDSDYGPRGIVQAWVVARATPKGVWIVPPWAGAYTMREPLDQLRLVYGARFVLNDRKRRFAYETEELARASFRIRKRRQIQHCRAGIARAEAALEWLEHGDAPAPALRVGAWWG